MLRQSLTRLAAKTAKAEAKAATAKAAPGVVAIAKAEAKAAKVAPWAVAIAKTNHINGRRGIVSPPKP